MIMDNCTTHIRTEQQDLAAKQYKLYDLELFKSQLKVFQTEVQQPQQSDEIKIQDQSIIDQHFPISHEEGRQGHNNFSINQSFDVVTEENLPLENKEITHKQSKGYIATGQKDSPPIDQLPSKQPILTQQQWDNRPRKCSNPMFEANKPEPESQLVRQLQILTKERSRYKQASYFSKKQRSVETKSIEDLFESYKHNEFKAQEYSHNDNLVILPSPKAKRADVEVFESKNQKDCQLCELTRERVQKHFSRKQSKQKEVVFEQFVPEKWVIGKQPKIKKVNLSPERSSVNKYLVEEEKNQYRSELSKSIFNGQVPLKEEYLEDNRLREEYLKSAKQRSNQIQKQLQKLKYPPKFMEASARSSSRKKIFALDSSPNLKRRVQVPLVPMTPKTTKHSNQKSHTYRNIFTSKLQKEKKSSNKKDNHSVDFKYVKEALINTRIHIFNSKSKEKDKTNDRSNSKAKIFKKISPKHTSPPKHTASPQKKDIIHDFNVMEMSYETREWFQKNQKEILLQSQKIYSYDLITRYIGESEIKVRLGQFIKGMIEPKRWILLMVDGVYARLKDRYLPN